MTQRGRATRSTTGPRVGERPRSDLGARRARLRAVIEPVVSAAGYDLEDLSVSRAGRRHVVRVIVDGDGGIDLDRVADVSRAVSSALDAAEETGTDLVAGEYQLEVSSPGVDRPLTLPRHWRRNVGRLVKVTARGGPTLPGQRGQQPPGERQLTARVVAADEERVVLDCDGQATEWRYPDLGPGRVQVEFHRLDEVADEDLAEIDDTETEDFDDEDDVEDEER
ncbi:ribosome maturation factor RimP [Micromonospora echinofusca]|uniref:Ribosome maturation factor RimP n=1 Tax=Micromonospora echinofusca TaxID=47858 RepID=A0ABS3W112_MICEH|nr:ribosome maturation factor RimP [Micromonospora echinofusca]MBO4210470.1 ribosome maturation factor RimP [Micromonospora echinofusca]